jgi:hypothetical protein
MSLYAVQKFLFEINRSEGMQARYTADRRGEVAGFDLTVEETEALVTPDIGKLFHLGVNGQILMHFAAFHQIEWQDYLQRMRDGISEHGPVREGVYAMTTSLDEVVVVQNPAVASRPAGTERRISERSEDSR